MVENSQFDALTGAFSRAMLAPWLKQALAHAQRTSDMLTLAIVDVDHFKSVNDAFGHVRGDQVLREITRRIQATLREADMLFRYGGDEFVLVLQGADVSKAQILMQRIIHAVRDVTFAGTPPLTMTVSIGAASIAETDGSAEDLFERADARLYSSKRQGRNQLQASDRESEDGQALAMDASLSSGRLIERDHALGCIRSFIESLSERKRYSLKVVGVPGSGQSRMLAEAGRYAALLGYGVLSLQGKPGYGSRMFASILDGRRIGSLWDDLPHPMHSGQHIIEVLSNLLAVRGFSGVLLSIDGADQLDPATLALLREIIAAKSIPQVGVITCANHSETVRLDCGAEAEVLLEALSPGGARLCLRGWLRWDAPEWFAEKFYAFCEGLPGTMHRNLKNMRDMGLMSRTANGWSIDTTWNEALVARASSPDASKIGQFCAGEGFVGRESELAAVKNHLYGGGLLTLTGVGGVGKTRLALQAASEMAGHFSDGIFFAQFSGVDSSDMILSTIVQAINLRLQVGVDPRRLLVDFASKSNMLIILDSFEHLSHDLSLIDELLQAGPHLRLLVTSRVPLQLRVETVLHIEGFNESKRDAVPSPGPGFNPAEILFVQYARNVLPAFELSPDDRYAVLRICKAVSGLPLALRLAAAWVTVYSCTEIAEKLESDPEQANALSAIGYFWAQLGETEQRGARALSVFRGGFVQGAGQSIADVSPFFLSSLVMKSFLMRAQGGRYELHDLLRQYAQRQLIAHSQQWSELRDKHSRHFFKLSEKAAEHWHCTGEAAWSERLATEIDNLRATLSYFIDESRQGYALRMVAALGNFWIRQGFLLEGLRWTKLALDQQGIEEEPAFAAAMAAQGKLYFWGGQPELAVQAFQASLDAARGRGLPKVEAICHAWLAASYFRRGRYQQALELGQQALIVARDSGMPGEHALCLLTLGGVFLETGEDDRASECLTSCLTMFEQQGDTRRRALAHSFFGILQHRAGDHQSASHSFEVSIALTKEYGDRLNYAFALTYLGAVSTARGDSRDALFKLAGAREILHETGTHDWEALNLVFAAEACLAINDLSSAKAHMAQALNLSLNVGSVRRQLLAIAGFARIAAHQDDADRAVKLASLVLMHPECGAEAAIPARSAMSSVKGAAIAMSVGAVGQEGFAEQLEILKREIEAFDQHAGITAD